MNESDDDLEPLPVYEHTTPVPSRHGDEDRRFGGVSPTRSAVRIRRFSATFTRMTDLDPDLLEDLPNWWWRRADDARVRVGRRLVLEAPSFASGGAWQLRGSLRSPWLRRWIPVDLQLWPCLGAWTKVTLEPQRHVRIGRRYFIGGHRALDTLTARLTTELRGRC